MPAIPEILVLYYSRQGNTRQLALRVAMGIDSVGKVAARVRTVPPVSPIVQTASPPIPDSGSPYAQLSDLEETIGLAYGSPTRFGNMAAPMKHFWDQTGTLWHNGTLNGKPAAVFTSSSSMHGGQETTLLSMMLPLIHHGMLLLGLPYQDTPLHTTRSGGSPYGASHVEMPEQNPNHLSLDEQNLAFILGQRLAQISLKLCS